MLKLEAIHAIQQGDKEDPKREERLAGVIATLCVEREAALHGLSAMFVALVNVLAASGASEDTAFTLILKLLETAEQNPVPLQRARASVEGLVDKNFAQAASVVTANLKAIHLQAILQDEDETDET